VSNAALERLRRLGEPFMEELARAHWQAGAGHTRTIELQPIYEKHRAVSGRDSLDTALDAAARRSGRAGDRLGERRHRPVA
jgi:hypothetical protein